MNMKKVIQILPPKTSSLLNKYLQLPFRTTKIACPYWVNDLGKGIRGPFSGKGTPRQIVSASYKKAKKFKIDLDGLNRRELKKFMEDNRIGLDCSGFVFHLLNMFDKEKGGNGISNKYLKNTKIPSWRASWKINAEKLSSGEFTRKIRMKDAMPGDIIRLLAGKHIAFFVEVGKNSITYAHCSNYTKIQGCHLGKILIKDWKKNLEYQDWTELTGDESQYKDITYFPNLGDSIMRLKWLEEGKQTVL